MSNYLNKNILKLDHLDLIFELIDLKQLLKYHFALSMNRKSIINENFIWPEINDQDSQKIIEFLENFFSKEPNLRRKKTLPKKIRQQPNHKKTTKEPDFGDFIKGKIRIGINSITKAMEKNPSKFELVLVCKSCKPLSILTRHIQVMCSLSRTPAGCVQNLNTLSKIFNIKTVSALAICKNIDTADELNKNHEMLFENFLDDIRTKIIPLLNHLKNPFTSIKCLDSNLMVEDVKNGLNEVDLNHDKKSETEDKMQTFGSDFISLNSSKISNFIDFSNENFILFEDENSKLEMMEE